MASSRSLLFALCALGVLVFGTTPLPTASAAPAVDGVSGNPLNVPGMDFSSLSPEAKKQLAEVFQDAFCYCGCPHSVGQCLRSHHPCRHSKRMASLAASFAKTGMDSSEIILRMSKYYLSFASPRARFADLDPRMCRGNPEAPVTLVEFSDFECPYCGMARPVLEKFARRHSNVRLCFQPFPLQMHPHSKIAAQAALYARDHGKFWAMHDLLFENQKHFSKEEIAGLAKKLGLSSAAVTRLFAKGTYLDDIQKFRAEGLDAGVRATPTVYVNGRQLLLPVKAQYLELTLGDELEWSSHGNAWAKD